MKNYALIVAGGSGLRMGSEIPKQFLELKGKPILFHTIEKFQDAGIFSEIILVLPKSEIRFWKELQSKYNFKIEHRVVEGGNSRYESVKNGLKEIGNDGYVAIHDGVRPLVSTSLIKNCMKELDNYTNAIPSVEIVDSLRKLSEDENEIADRSLFRSIQTPQCFHSKLIKEAYKLPENEKTTDDASVFESAGNKIHLVPGEQTNLKITVVSDLQIAAFLIEN